MSMTGEVIELGQTWHIMLGTRVLRWTGVFRPGIVHRELEGNRDVKFDERWPLE
jgi:hypothetical protein